MEDSPLKKWRLLIDDFHKAIGNYFVLQERQEWGGSPNHSYIVGNSMVLGHSRKYQDFQVSNLLHQSPVIFHIDDGIVYHLSTIWDIIASHIWHVSFCFMLTHLSFVAVHIHI